jgi:hypothetical protein
MTTKKHTRNKAITAKEENNNKTITAEKVKYNLIVTKFALAGWFSDTSYLCI